MTPPPDDLRAHPNGPAWAAILAAAAGCWVMGLLTDLSQAFKGVSNALNLFNPVGDLSGKSIGATLAWLFVWAALHACWKNRNIERGGTVAAVAILLVLAALGMTFPPLFDLL
jgi:hypothetical protein